MQAIPLLLRQQLRSGIGVVRTASSAPIRPAPRISTPPRSLLPETNGFRELSICNRCRLRAQVRFYSSEREGQGQSKDGSGAAEKDIKPEQEPEPSDGVAPGNISAAQHSQVQETSGFGGSRGGQEGLPSEEEGRRSNFSKQFSSVMDNLQSNVFIAGQRLNDLTGYSAIETLKREIQEQENQVRETRARVRQAKEDYSSAINRRSTSQREVNELLQRKHAWTPTDLERFTSLYRSDHANERTETEAQEALGTAEREAEEAAAKLSKSILARYHEEQIWSDKIRRMSTWGTWGLMGVNVLLFLIFQVAVEPWRRKRLVKGFEEKVMEAIERESGVLNATPQSQAEVDGNITPTSPPATPSDSDSDSATETTTTSTTTTTTEPDISVEEDTTTTPSETPDPDLPPKPQRPLQFDLASFSLDSWKQQAQDLFSDRRSVVVSQRDITTIALEGAAAGAAIMGLLVALFRPR